MAIDVGEKIPAGVFKELGPAGPQVVSGAEIFNGKRVVLFSCPGAFTPKSTEQQIPSYLHHATAIFAAGVDSIVCISVNDAFVMNAWGKSCRVGNTIRMLADGHAEFHTSLGLEMDCTRFTLGIRSHRFSMFVNDGTVEILNIEEPGGYAKSDAGVIAGQLKQQPT